MITLEKAIEIVRRDFKASESEFDVTLIKQNKDAWLFKMWYKEGDPRHDEMVTGWMYPIVYKEDGAISSSPGPFFLSWNRHHP